MKKAKTLAIPALFFLTQYKKIEAILKEAERAFYKSDTLLEDICLK